MVVHTVESGAPADVQPVSDGGGDVFLRFFLVFFFLASTRRSGIK
jgi:hypothetical protein